jgi:hypothetical protein
MTGTGRALRVGDRIRVLGGYAADPPWLRGGVGYRGTVERFIPEGEADVQLAAVVQLDEDITVDVFAGRWSAGRTDSMARGWSRTPPTSLSSDRWQGRQVPVTRPLARSVIG